MRTALRILTVLCLASMVPVQARAQSLSDQMFNLFVQSVVLARTPGGGGIVAHTPVFADDPVVFKKLIYEMRFDPASSRFALFGPFYVGMRCAPAALGAALGVAG